MSWHAQKEAALRHERSSDYYVGPGYDRVPAHVFHAGFPEAFSDRAQEHAVPPAHPNVPRHRLAWGEFGRAVHEFEDGWHALAAAKAAIHYAPIDPALAAVQWNDFGHDLYALYKLRHPNAPPVAVLPGSSAKAVPIDARQPHPNNPEALPTFLAAEHGKPGRYAIFP